MWITSIMRVLFLLEITRRREQGNSCRSVNAVEMCSRASSISCNCFKAIPFVMSSSCANILVLSLQDCMDFSRLAVFFFGLMKLPHLKMQGSHIVVAQCNHGMLIGSHILNLQLQHLTHVIQCLFQIPCLLVNGSQNNVQAAI